MSAKRALIVDDSKSARVVLSRLLEKHELQVETRDSAESALEYLETHRPDVIFMDHVMSGMDGLSAVQLIKKDPSVADIPILMYTSQDGAIYADAAKASGADGILPKQMSPGDIADALVRLKVISAKPAPVVATADPAGVVLPSAVPSITSNEVRAIVDGALREQSAELRRFLSGGFDGIGARLNADAGRLIQESADEVIRRLTPPPPEPPPPPPRPWGWIVALIVAILAAAALAVVVYSEHQSLTAIRATVERQAAALAAAPTTAAPVAVGGWPGERHVLGYGDAPFPAARVAQAGNWLATLEQRGFVGEAKLIVSIADYCLTGNPGEGFALAPPEMAAAKCDLKGSPADETRSAADRIPTALASAMATLHERTHGEIDAKVVYTKGSVGDAMSAGQWNAAAGKVHFVEFVALPRGH